MILDLEIICCAENKEKKLFAANVSQLFRKIFSQNISKLIKFNIKRSKSF